MFEKAQAIAKRIIAPMLDIAAPGNAMQVTNAEGMLFTWNMLSSPFVRQVFNTAVAEYNQGRDYLALEQICWALQGKEQKLSEAYKKKVWDALVELGRTFVSAKYWLNDNLYIFRGPLLPIMTIDTISIHDHEWGIKIMDSPYAQGWQGKHGVREQPLIADEELSRYRVASRNVILAALIDASEEIGITQIIIPLDQFYSACVSQTVTEKFVVLCVIREVLADFKGKGIIKDFGLLKEANKIRDVFLLQI